MSYIPPSWAQKPDPSHEWVLLEIKGGVQVGSYPLHTQPCTILGRAADQVDIPLQHESTSRQHARIAFDSGGFPWLRDLGSTHGTTCNKRKLPPLAVGKIERNDQSKGSRGVMIFPGDILQFGASTRLFCVEGPPEFERGAVQARQIQLEQKRREEMELAAAIRNDDNDDDDEGEADAVSEPVKKVVPMDTEVPQKYQKMLERLNAARYKLQNLQTEDDRIRRKGELTEGQEKQLQRNAEREKALMENIDTLETDLYDKLHPEQIGNKEGSSSRKRHQQGLRDDGEDDEFFDRTKRLEKSVVEDGESEMTLIEKWKRLQTQQQERRRTKLVSAQNKMDRLSAQHSDLMAAGDSEEAFFIQNDLQIAKEEVDKVTTLINESETNLAEIEKFLRVVNPKLKFNRITGYIGTEDPKKKEEGEDEKTPSWTSIMAPPLPRRPAVVPTNSQTAKAQQSEETEDEWTTSIMAPPLPRQLAAVVPASSQAVKVQQQESQSINETFTTMLPPPPPPKRVLPSSESIEEKVLPDQSGMPPPKRKRVVGPNMPPPSQNSSTSSPMTGNPHSGPNNKDRPRPKAQSTLDFISSMNKSERMIDSTTSLPKEETTTSTASAVILPLDPKADTWRAPTGQDGSGTTRLNAKFAGRY